MIFFNTTVSVWFLASNSFGCLWVSNGFFFNGFHDLGVIHSSSTVHWFLEFWWFRGSLIGLEILGRIAILVWFFTFNYFDYFLDEDGWFVDIMIFGYSPAISRSIGF